MPKTIVIHVSGTPGTGKTTLGTTLQRKYGKKVVVVDTDSVLNLNDIDYLDDLSSKVNNTKTWNNYIKKWRKLFRKKIYDIIKLNQGKIIIFVGWLAHMGLSVDCSCWERWNKGHKKIPYQCKTQFVTFKADYKFFIKIDPEILLDRFFNRHCGNLYNNLRKYWNCIIKKPSSFSSAYLLFEQEVDLMEHKKMGYKIESSSEVRYEIDNIVQRRYRRKK